MPVRGTSSNNRTVRRPIAVSNSISQNRLSLSNPWVTVWWSASFPGFGHLLLGQHVKGFMLILWEVVINVKSQLNAAILYSFIGDFETAKGVLDSRWLYLYAAVYIYAIWDTHRTSVDLNKHYLLARHENARVKLFQISLFEINYTDRLSPQAVLAWSLLMPGLGHLYLHALVRGFIILIWWTIITYCSHLFVAVQFSFLGEFELAVKSLEPEWILFIPSLYVFGAYDAYRSAVELNNLQSLEQAQYLQEHYQSPNFDLAELKSTLRDELR